MSNGDDTGNGNNLSVEEQQKAFLKKMIEDQEAVDSDLREKQLEFQDQIADARLSLFNNLKTKRTPQFSREVVEIATILQQQPMLIPVVKRFLTEKMGAIQEAIKGVLETP
jgi:hypothetical protein